MPLLFFHHKVINFVDGKLLQENSEDWSGELLVVVLKVWQKIQLEDEL